MAASSLIYSGIGFPSAQEPEDRRTTLAPTKRQAETILTSPFFACHQNMPFNCWITIQWSLAGLADDQAGRATMALLKIAGDYVRYHGGPFAASWVRGNGYQPNRLRSGTHVHILAYVPIRLWADFSKRLRRWVVGLTIGSTYIAGLIQKRKFLRSDHFCDCYAVDSYTTNLCVLISYQLKSIPPDHLATLGLTKHHKEGGLIIGKRCGTTENIGRKAWEAHCWTPASCTLPRLQEEWLAHCAAHFSEAIPMD